MNKSTRDLLAAIEALYSVALSPSEYETFAEEFDQFISGVEPGSASATSLLEHVQRAISILDRLQDSARQYSDTQSIVDRETGATAIVERGGTILASNAAWKQAYPDVLKTIWSIAPDEGEQNRIRSAKRTLHEVSKDRTAFIRFIDQNDAYVNLTISRLFQHETEDQPPRYLFRTGQSSWSDDVNELMLNEFGLTPAENALLRRMVEGDSFAQISDDTGRGVETLKSQSKSIYRKMNAQGREDAVRMAFQLHVLLQRQQMLKQPAKHADSPSFVCRRDGRKIAWSERGAPNGTPVLFLHGMSLGHGFTQRFDDQLMIRSIRLICVDRPGYGKSDPTSNWRNALDEWKACFPDLLDALEVTVAPILTHTSGVLLACAAARSWPDRVSQICALAGGVPITDPGALADYPSQLRILSRAARVSPLVLRFIFSSSAAFYQSPKGRSRLIQRTYDTVPSDAAALKNPEIEKLVHDGMAMLTVGGFDGFVGDGVQIFNDWSDEVSNLKVPLHYIIGEEDPICPLSWAQSFAQKFGHVDVTSVPNAGQLLHHTHPERIWAILDEYDFPGNSRH